MNVFSHFLKILLDCGTYSLLIKGIAAFYPVIYSY